MALIEYADKNNLCHVHQKTIAKDAQVSRTTASKAYETLEKCGYISVIRRLRLVAEIEIIQFSDVNLQVHQENIQMSTCRCSRCQSTGTSYNKDIQTALSKLLKNTALVKEKTVSSPDVGGLLELQGSDGLNLHSGANMPELSDDDAPPERDADDITLDSFFLGFSQFDVKPKKTDSQPKAKPSPPDAACNEKELKSRLENLRNGGGDGAMYILKRERDFPIHKTLAPKSSKIAMDYSIELNGLGISTVSLDDR